MLGVLTDRDLVVKGMARGLDAATTPVSTVMTQPAVTCFIDGDLGMAEDLMAEEQKSRLVLTDGDGRVAGVLSIADIVERAPEARGAADAAGRALARGAGPARGRAARPGARSSRRRHTRNTARGDETVFTGGKHDDGYTEFP